MMSQAADPDALVFADESSEDVLERDPWNILIVDDDEDVHTITRMLLKDFRFDERPLNLVSAYSGAQAREILADASDVALIFLDVVMETDHAGLDLVHYVRKELGNGLTPIVLRTGQPGAAPERAVITEYDINDYRDKTELEATRLFTVTHTSLKAYKAMRNLAAANEELAATLQQLEQFNYMVSHDLQAPMRNIMQLVEELGEDHAEQLDEDGQEVLGLMKQRCARAQNLVRDLMLLAKIGQEDLPMSAVDTGAVAAEAIQALESDIADAEADVYCAELPVVTGNATYLRQLFQNLVGNAIKYRSERPVEVHIKATRQDGSFLFSVQDNGIGMAQDDAERMFRPFARLHGSSEYEGTGIGLAICRKIVELHGGHIWAVSEPNVGSTFLFELPVRAA